MITKDETSNIMISLPKDLTWAMDPDATSNGFKSDMGLAVMIFPART